MPNDTLLRHTTISRVDELDTGALNQQLEAARGDVDVVVLEGAQATAGQVMDELLRVTALSPQHAVVVPAIVPATYRDSHVIVLPDRLPAVVRTSYLKLCGGFDGHFDSPLVALADFALRANEIGGSTVVADRTDGGVRQLSSGTLVGRLQHRHETIGDRIALWAEQVMTPEEQFEALLVPSRPEVRRVLLDVTTLDPIPNGSARSALATLEILAAQLPVRGLDVHVLSNPDATDYFALERLGLPVHDPRGHGNVYDVAIAVSPIVTVVQADRLSRLAARWVAVHLDVIALRTLSLRAVQPDRFDAVLQSLRHADRVIAISDASARDVRALDGRGYIHAIEAHHQGVSSVVLTRDRQGKTRDDLPDETQAALAEGGYILVVGNNFPHKQVVAAVRALAGIERPIIAMAELPEELHHSAGVHELASGGLSDALIASLYANAGVVVFPSAYEGFGLPVVEAAAYGLAVVALRTDAVEEVVGAFGLQGAVSWFDSFYSLAETVEERLALGRSEPRHLPDMSGFAGAIAAAVTDLLDEPISIPDTVLSRWDHYRSIRSAERQLVTELRSARERLTAVELVAADQSDARQRAEQARNELGAFAAQLQEEAGRIQEEAGRMRDEMAQLRSQLSEITSSRAYSISRAAGDLAARLRRRRS